MKIDPDHSTTNLLTRCGLIAAVLITCAMSLDANAGDWPMWRYDAGRTAASPEALPDNLQLLWAREGTPRVQAWDDPLNMDLMTYDRLFEPIVMDGRMFIGHSDGDKLSAIDVNTGKELWTVYADAPVRLPPAGWNGAVYFRLNDK